MLEQISNTVRFHAFFTLGGQGQPGLTVTVDVRRNGTAVVTDGAATEEGGGFYYYDLASGSVTVEGQYTIAFKTTGAADQQHLPGLVWVQKAGVENLDATVGSRLATAGYTAPPSSTTIAAAVWDRLTSALTTVGSIGKLLVDRIDAAISSATAPTAGEVADAVWDETLADHVTLGTTGKKLAAIGLRNAAVLAPALARLTLNLIRGDAYHGGDGRAIAFSSSDWPDLTGATIVLTIRGRLSDEVLLSVGDTLADRVVGVGDQTVVFEPGSDDTVALLPGVGTGKYDVQATLSNGRIVTLAVGLANVTEDQTRA